MAVTSRDLRSTKSLGQSRQSAIAFPSRSVNGMAYLVVFMFVLAAANILFSSLSEWARIKLDDIRYGRPRTFHLTAYVGHEEQSGMPTHLIGMNMDRRVIVIEIPGGDASKARTLVGPYLFGAGEDLTPVKLRLLDVNRDGQDDLIVSVKAEEMIYMNENGTFRLITPEERQQIQQQGY